MDRWQAKVNANAEATERWMRKLLRAANELSKLRQERKRLMRPPRDRKPANRSLEDIAFMAASGTDFNDEIPL